MRQQPIPYTMNSLEDLLTKVAPEIERDLAFKLEKGKLLNKFEVKMLGGKSKAAELMIKGITFDTALPQTWLNQWQGDNYDAVMFYTVWAYPEGSIAGLPCPLTEEAALLIVESINN